MRLLRVFLLAIAAVAASFTVLAPVGATAPYGGSSIKVSDVTPPVGGTLLVTGTGFAPNSPVECFFLSTPVLLGTFVADASGVVSASVTLPASATGRHTLRLVGVAPDQAPLTLESTIEIGADVDLPLAGSDTANIVSWALAFMVIGTSLVAFVVLRRRNVSPASE